MIEQLAFPIDPDPFHIDLPAIRLRQPIGDIFVASVSYRDLREITYFDVRRVLREERDVERYLGIQRPLSEARVSDLSRYVEFFDATFPTSIIVAVDSDFASFDEEKRILSISNVRAGEDKPDIAFRNLFRVIDGQHRIAGLENFEGPEFDLSVSIFIGADIADQAYIFATVNLEQTKVSRSLVLDLFDLAKTRSPFKTCHNIAVALDTSIGGPFFHRIKRLGVATSGRYGETLTQATFVDSIIGYISKDPKGDRDLLLRNKPIPRSKESQTIFRDWFIDGDDVSIGKVVEAYFAAVAARWPSAWGDVTRGLMLNRTNGFRALARLLGPAYRSVAQPGNRPGIDRFLPLFKKVPAEDGYFNTENFKPGSSGEAQLRQYLQSHMFEGESQPGFNLH